ncbi:eukaryotic translation initiation factor 4E-binding protein Mextli isoform X2 [Drosophila subobscura]|uniref:eukaryotic translation initiation factor 4E-binding protein Mextli isoform X2 n=1 Tax=Drosophila subobscura TaxID=7241 RepID=UPI00155A6693|nr:eukaryotic translation initiation factor 4E-binding protein Mextli isoform X2 [Drosophila subobscura]
MAHTHLGRAVKNIEAPRPLKTQSRASLKNSYLVMEELIQLIDNVTVGLQSCNTTTESITLLLHNLRVHGPQLEAVSKDTLDRAFVVFRNASQDERLNIMTRLKLLELIELRAKSWEDNDTIAYYKSKQQVSNVELPPEPYQHDVSVQQGGFLSTSPTFGVSGGGGGMNVGAAAAAAAVFNAASAAAAAQAAAIAAVGSPNQQHMLLPPGEVIRNSGKFPKPTKIPGKTYCKDEVVIRNADSGKVMGIKGRRVHMIEELSETIISFQRVNPGAKERLVQITGPAEEKINYAKQLMEDTIRRNASPVRLEPAPAAGGSCSSLNSSNSDDAVVVQPRTPGGSSLANRLSFNSAQNFMTAQQAAAQQISQITQHQQAQQQQQQHHHHQQQVAAIQVAAAAAAQAQATAAAGEYKFTVNVGQRVIKITGDCCELVRVAKLVLDDYFSSSEFLASMEAGAAFDGNSLVSPVTTPSTPLPGAGPPQFMLPLADSGIGLNYAASSANNNGDGDDEVFADTTNGASSNAANQNGLARSRRSHFSRKESTPENKVAREKLDVEERPMKTSASRVSYDIEHLIYYSQSPHAWALPNDWQKMLETTPSILRNKVISGSDGQLKCLNGRHVPSPESITNAPKSHALTMASINPMNPEGDAQVAIAIASASDANTLTETNKQSRVMPQERELRRNPKPSAESDRNLYNRQLQIITSTMGAQAKYRQPNSHSHHTQSQLKAVFQRYTEDDECLMAWFDEQTQPELNNNRTFA